MAIPASREGAHAWIFQANPAKYELRAAVRKLREIPWSVTRHKHEIASGDHVYLWESGPQGGIVGVARVIGSVSPGPIPDGDISFSKERPEKTGPDDAWARLRILGVVEPALRRAAIASEPRLSNLRILRMPRGTNFPVHKEEAKVLWGLLGGGMNRVRPRGVRAELKKAPDRYLSPPEVEAAADGILEGASISVLVNRFERDPDARRRCIETFGPACRVCGFDFEKRYGEIGAGFIHVPHLIPLQKIRKRYRVDAERELQPVCPNCHATLHRGDRLLSIEQLKSRLL